MNFSLQQKLDEWNKSFLTETFQQDRWNDFEQRNKSQDRKRSGLKMAELNKVPLLIDVLQ